MSGDDASPSTSKKDLSPIERMNEYKGPSVPSAIIPGSGFVAGFLVPLGLHAWLRSPSSSTSSSSRSESAVDGVLLVLQQFGWVALLFTAEFFHGALARSTSPKAAFSPSAAAASGQNPFAVVRANRIHQNHIESLCILAPSALAAAAVGADPTLVALTVQSWVGFRFLYRVGYCYDANPFWRLLGVAASTTQANICLWLWFRHATWKV